MRFCLFVQVFEFSVLSFPHLCFLLLRSFQRGYSATDICLSVCLEHLYSYVDRWTDKCFTEEDEHM